MKRSRLLSRKPWSSRFFSSHSSDIIQGPSLLRTSVYRPSPSLVALPGLRSLPFWTQLDMETQQTRVAYQDPQITHAVQFLEQHAADIANEYQTVNNNNNNNNNNNKPSSDYPHTTEHHKLHTGQWDWHSFVQKGQIQSAFAQQFPVTASLLVQLKHEGMLFTGTPFGYAFFSTLHASSKIAAHTAPMNFRLRVHLPLQVPKHTLTTTTSTSTERPACGIRVGPVTRTWQEGKALVLDDSYEHEVWNDTAETRVLLLVDLWHPDITLQERKEIVALFDHAQQQGWWSHQSK
ncbi:aspartate beta-hydroxylase [Fistulifera solaris]|uniref:Aspartate beta-hydroxylase n=1 Tax=Fistulifera solaris TaxID=1519565 RepID=A0A1Z5J9G6_FISSO|nr:aspartate beta-hydroxylase [Fistulifera solaris]|eukprot:GAX10630.1 aspartate beta-hydroxylase [Fistulifera solaris]